MCATNYGCNNLISVVIGASVAAMGDYAFYSCSNLRKLIMLPNTPPILGYLCFQYYPNIVYVSNSNYDSFLRNQKKYDFLSSMFEVDDVIYVPLSPSERTCVAIDCTYKSNVKNIVIGETVDYKGVSMTVTKINPYVLTNNKYLESIEVNANCSIGNRFADSANNLQLLNISNTVKNIGENAFEGTFVNSTNGVANINNQGKIGASAFRNCTGLKAVTIAESVSSIDAYAFNKCSSLSTINIPQKLTSISNNCFEGCISLQELELPEELENIGEYAFYNSGLKEISIPGTVTNIGDCAFTSCSALKMFKVEEGVGTLNIGYNSSSYVVENRPMFYGCSLEEIFIGRNLSYQYTSNYGFSPFYNNPTLKKITFSDIPNEVFVYEFYGCSKLKEVSIGDGAEKIGDYAFSGCSSIETFSFGANVKSIGREAFSDCISMTKLYAEPDTPPVCGEQALDDIVKWNCTLYVPESANSLYKEAGQWKEFFFIESIDFSGVQHVETDRGEPLIYNIYDFNGRLLKTTKEKSYLNQLNKGLYIINGKKTIVR